MPGAVAVPGPLPVDRPRRIPPIQCAELLRLPAGQRRCIGTPVGQPPPQIEARTGPAAGVGERQVSPPRRVSPRVLEPFSEQFLVPPRKALTVPGTPRHSRLRPDPRRHQRRVLPNC